MATIRQLLARPLSWYGVALYALIAAVLIVFYIWILQINNHFLVAIPARGGSITEGMIGAPHLINPVLASTETDISLTKLLYSGLMRQASDGSIVPALAQSVTTSPDGLTYTFVLHDKLKWSDGKPIQSGDVSFTIQKLALFQPNSYWQSVTVTTPDPKTIVIRLPAPHADFLSLATVGIIPSHIWGDIPDELFDTATENLHPVGSGLYTFNTIRESNGIVTEINLTQNRHALIRPYIDTYHVLFFANQTALLDALNNHSIDITLAATSDTAIQTSGYTIAPAPTMITVGLFRLESESVLANSATVDILNHAIDKNKILAIVEHGYGILPDTARAAVTHDEAMSALAKLGYTLSNSVLQKNGTPISLSINVENDPSLLTATHALIDELHGLGINATIKAFERGTFQRAVNANEYSVFLGRMRTVPNGYASVIPLYTQSYPFIYRPDVHITLPKYLDSPFDRYRTLTDWHTRVNNVWKIFIHNNQ